MRATALIVTSALLGFCAMPGRAENIGMAHEPAPNARSQELTKIFNTFAGSWKGTYTYYDDRQGRYVSGPTNCVYTKAPLPNVLTLDCLTERSGGAPLHAYTVMVVQADGASWRQMAFTEGGGRLQDKVITGYHYTDDRNWTVDLIEVQQGLGTASAVLVAMVVKDGHLDMRKFRKLEGGAPAARDYESLTSLDRVP